MAFLFHLRPQAGEVNRTLSVWNEGLRHGHSAALLGGLAFYGIELLAGSHAGRGCTVTRIRGASAVGHVSSALHLTLGALRGHWLEVASSSAATESHSDQRTRENFHCFPDDERDDCCIAAFRNTIGGDNSCRRTDSAQGC